MFKQIEHEFNKYSGMHYLIDDIHKYEHSFTKLYKYGMILLGVDSFKQGEARRIIEFFCNKGFILINYRIKCLNRTQTENLFLPTSSCVKCEDLKWWMIQDAANLGAFCGIIFYHENSTMEENCLRRLNAFKGKSCPLKNTEGVVRYDFAAINVCLNLIHIPDTYGDFFKDSSPFYTVKEISKLLSDTPHMFEGDELFHLSLYEENAEVYHFETTLYKLKMFLAYTLADQNKVGKLIKHYQIQYQAHQTLSQREERRQLFINGINDELIMLAELS